MAEHGHRHHELQENDKGGHTPDGSERSGSSSAASSRLLSNFFDAASPRSGASLGADSVASSTSGPAFLRKAFTRGTPGVFRDYSPVAIATDRSIDTPLLAFDAGAVTPGLRAAAGSPQNTATARRSWAHGYPPEYADACRSGGVYAKGPPTTFVPYELPRDAERIAKKYHDEIYPRIPKEEQDTTGVEAFADALWSKMQCIVGVEPSLFRVDVYGNVLYRGDRNGASANNQARLSKTTPLSWHIDHWFPVSRGGKATRENLRVVHWRANALKLDRLECFVPWWQLQTGVSVAHFVSVLCASEAHVRDGVLEAWGVRESVSHIAPRGAHAVQCEISAPSPRPQQTHRDTAAADDAEVRPSGDEPRKRRRWTDAETRLLAQGILQYGRGNWARILTALAFDGRTAVDLKDKWRNVERAGMADRLLEEASRGTASTAPSTSPAAAHSSLLSDSDVPFLDTTPVLDGSASGSSSARGSSATRDARLHDSAASAPARDPFATSSQHSVEAARARARTFEARLAIEREAQLLSNRLANDLSMESSDAEEVSAQRAELERLRESFCSEVRRRVALTEEERLMQRRLEDMRAALDEESEQRRKLEAARSRIESETHAVEQSLHEERQQASEEARRCAESRVRIAELRSELEELEAIRQQEEEAAERKEEEIQSLQARITSLRIETEEMDRKQTRLTIRSVALRAELDMLAGGQRGDRDDDGEEDDEDSTTPRGSHHQSGSTAAMVLAETPTHIA